MDKRMSHNRRSGRISQKPSFASILLDSVYRSIDENESDYRPSRKLDTRVLEPSSITSHNQITTTQPEKQKNVAVREKVIFQHHANTYTTSSSSDSSNFSVFSSSDTETVSRHQIGLPARIALSSPLPEKKKSKTGSIRSKLRELRWTRTPVSPGARLANFLNSLFTTSARKASKETEAPVSSPTSRSYLTKTGSLRERQLPAGILKRPVRFNPVTDKCLHEGVLPGGLLAQERKMKDTVEELLLRRFKVDGDEADSDSSSDLFELENLNAETEARGGYKDELPVFETTNLGALRARSLRF